MCDADRREQRALRPGAFPPMKQLKAARPARFAAVHRPRARCAPENMLNCSVAVVIPRLSYISILYTEEATVSPNVNPLYSCLKTPRVYRLPLR